jgi:glycosyltransferase involved in cell wall biosynthesis
MAMLRVTPAPRSVAGPLACPTPRVSVVIPTYNEARNLPHVFAALPPDLHEVIVVDGHSVDGTPEVARRLRPDVRIVLQNRRGKGNAMACGFSAVTGDVVVMLDADGSADPGEIPRYVDALAGADFAKGSRFTEGGRSDDITPTRAWGNGWLNRIANAFFGTRHTDLCYGYNAFWAYCLPALELDAAGPGANEKRWGDGFEIETLINARIAKAGLRVAEVPSYEHPRIHGQSNLNTWRDGVRVLRALVVERLNSSGKRMRPAVDRERAAWLTRPRPIPLVVPDEPLARIA